MTRYLVSYSGSPSEALGQIQAVTAALFGKSNTEAAKGIQLAVGMQALSDIFDAFIEKSDGKRGEDGIQWPKLSPKTLAYGRRAPRGRGHAPGGKDGLLTKKQLERWRKIYAGVLLRDQLSGVEDKQKAAAIAWAQIKKEGGKTKLAEYADRPHQILRDTGVLLNSLSPGAANSPNQIFQMDPGSVTVGTNVPYASTHHHGDPSRGIPKRPLWPKQIPTVWRDRWTKVMRDAIAVAIKQELSK